MTTKHIRFSITVRGIEDGYLVDFSQTKNPERTERFCSTEHQLAQRIEDFVKKAI